jgi:N-acetylglutamate synthase-like GNAT family acetyltransferase
MFFPAGFVQLRRMLTMEKIRYFWADAGDQAAIESLLKQCGLPYEDIASHPVDFVVAKAGETIVGVNGIEIYNQDALLRSLAVEPAFRGTGISRELDARILARAHQKQVTKLYLLTQTVENYAAKMGFQKIARESVPQSIQSTTEFKSLCPKTAVCMMKVIDEGI